MMSGSLSDNRIVIGTAGFQYRDWIGPFYPQGCSDKLMLEYYGQRFSVLELNFTYYRLPTIKTMTSFVDRTPDEFTFLVKGHRAMTHDDLDLQAVTDASCRFRQTLEPLRQAGKLGAVLLQFPYRFAPTRANCDRLLAVRQQLMGLSVAVEFRRADWVSAELFERTLGWLRQNDIAYCCVDEPRLQGLVPPVGGISADVGYVRFHGRNEHKWWNHDQAWERYNYDYSDEELSSWIDPITNMARQATAVYVVFNNHYGGSAPNNAATMQKLLDSID